MHSHFMFFCKKLQWAMTIKNPGWIMDYASCTDDSKRWVTSGEASPQCTKLTHKEFMSHCLPVTPKTTWGVFLV